MKRTTLLAFVLIIAFGWLSPVQLRADSPLVIAHRGASGYLPEHTLEAKAMAHAMGADYIEQDLVLSRDDHPVVLHDIHLDTVTNVAEVFPNRSRNDGRFYAIDFDLVEIKQLRATERVNLKTGKAVFPNRFPARTSDFAVPTLAEEIELIQGMNHSTGRSAGIYPEIKNPKFHRKEGKDISKIVLETLARYGYDSPEDRCFVQCFDITETKRLKSELGCRLPVVQLIGGVGYQEISTPEGLKSVAKYADGVGPPIARVLRADGGRLQPTTYVTDAHAAGLVVHPYTLRADDLPEEVESYEQFVQILYADAKVDGAFTDFPDRTRSALQQ